MSECGCFNLNRSRLHASGRSSGQRTTRTCEGENVDSSWRRRGELAGRGRKAPPRGALATWATWEELSRNSTVSRNSWLITGWTLSRTGEPAAEGCWRGWPGCITVYNVRYWAPKKRSGAFSAAPRMRQFVLTTCANYSKVRASRSECAAAITDSGRVVSGSGSTCSVGREREASPG